MFDEYFNPPSYAVTLVQEAVAPRATVLANSLVSTSIDQDALSLSIPSTQEQEHSPTISQGFEESPKTPIFHDDPLHESLHEDLTSQGSSSNVRQTHTPFEHLSKWTKDHLIENVISDPSRSISTRKQLQTDAISGQPIACVQAEKGPLTYLNNTIDGTNSVKLLNLLNILPTVPWILHSSLASLGMTYYEYKFKIQISHSPSDMFINQSKYASEIVKKYGLLTTDFVDTPLVEKSKLDKDLQGKQIDATLYRGMIGSLMYLTSSRPDLIYAFCLCARYQAKPTKKHLLVVK
ncbi:hypothetical protein Tco_0857319 [Tanacetum coccineum]|uniref:Reverse transcriptase Ty1/copia-type domain-containing protein n=1 Tax=Tanacetum coccineum TaxID=301880 RepID=A0ABQ5B814_9ASTR